MRSSPAAFNRNDHRGKSFAAAGFWPLLALVLFLGPRTASAQPSDAIDFSPRNQGWNGTSRLVALARDAGVHLETPDQLDVGTLEPGDALLWLHPSQALPVAFLTDFLKRGGRLALADEHGTGRALFEVFQIDRRDPTPAADAAQLRDHPALRLARPLADHPLAAEVMALVTNHPQVLHHARLEPIFSLDNSPEEAIVLVGAVGGGRLVAIGDPSVFINDMLEIEGNRRFAVNLLRYLSRTGGRSWLVTDQTRIEGARLVDPARDPLDPLRRGFARLAEMRLPPEALRVAAGLLVLLGLIGAAGSLSRRSPYHGLPYPIPKNPANRSTQLTALSQPDRLDDTLRLFKSELESEILRQLGLVGPFDLEHVMRHLSQTSLSLDARQQLVGLLGELERLVTSTTPQLAPTPARANAAIQQGLRLLSSLDHACRRTSERPGARQPTATS